MKLSTVIPVLLVGMTVLVAADTDRTDQVTRADSGTLIVVNKGANTVNVIDIASKETVAVLPTGVGPHEVVSTQDGQLAVVTNYAGGNSLTVIDVMGLSVVRTIDLAEYPRPHGISFLPGDTQVAVTSESSRQVVIVDVLSGEIVGAIPTEQNGSHMLALASGGARIYTSNGAGTISELDVDGMRLVRTVEVAPRLEAIGIPPGDGGVWVGSNERGTVNVVDMTDGRVDAVLDGFSWPYRIYFTPDGVTTVIPDLSNHDIRFFDRASRVERASLDFPGAGPQGLMLGGDDRTLYLSLNRENRLAVIDMESIAVTGYIETGAGPDGIAYSPIELRR